MWEEMQKQFKVILIALLCLLLVTTYLSVSYAHDNKNLVAYIADCETRIATLEQGNKNLSQNNTELNDMLETDKRGAYFDDTVVYVNWSGSVYHRSYCQYVKSSSYTKFLTDAKNDGMKACSKCW